MAKKTRFSGKKSTVTKPQSQGLLGIVIPIYGEWGFAEKAILSIPKAIQGYNDGYQIIVVDNGTPDFTMENGEKVTPDKQATRVKELLRPGVDQFIRLEENQGYPGALNAGVARLANDLIMILTADVELGEGAITEMVKTMDDPQVGVVGIKLLFSEDSPHGTPGFVQHAGHTVHISGKIYHAKLNWPADDPRVNYERECPSVTGACFMTRKFVWEEVGGMNRAYGAGTYEDVEYCMMVRAHGRKVIYNPSAVGYHYVGASIKHGANKYGFPLATNELSFKGKFAQALAWDEYIAFDCLSEEDFLMLLEEA